MSRDAAVKLRKLLEVFSVLVAAGSCLYDAIDTQMRRHQVSDDSALCEITPLFMVANPSDSLAAM